jgi:hypothetical protein
MRTPVECRRVDEQKLDFLFATQMLVVFDHFSFAIPIATPNRWTLANDPVQHANNDGNAIVEIT